MEEMEELALADADYDSEAENEGKRGKRDDSRDYSPKKERGQMTSAATASTTDQSCVNSQSMVQIPQPPNTNDHNIFPNRYGY